MSTQVIPNSAGGDEGGERQTKFRILKVGGRKRAFSLEPVFWEILEDAADQASMRLGEYVSQLLADAPSGNNSSYLRSKAAQWAAEQADRLREKGLLSLAQRIAVSHSSPAFIINQHRQVVGCNKQFEDLIARERSRFAQVRLATMQLRMDVPIREIERILSDHPEKFLRTGFAARSGDLERSGALNVMLIGEEKEQVLFLCLVRSIDEARRCA